LHPQLDPVTYHRDVLPVHLAGERGAAAAHDTADIAPLTLVVDGLPFTYASDGAAITVTPAADEGARAVVELSRPAWSDLVQLLRTVPSLALAGDLTFARGGFGHLSRWEPALRCLYAGIPIYDPATADLDGVDLARTFAFADMDAGTGVAVMTEHLQRVGFLHVREVFTTDEIAALNAEVDRLATAAEPGDGRSWWATDDRGDEVLCRLVYAGTGSAQIAALPADERLQRLVALSPHEYVTANDRMEGEAVLLKTAGELKGLANIPWHTDCGLGGHPIVCPSLAIGIQLTAASADAGRFEAVAGSHGQTCRYAADGDLTGLPVVGVDTEPGDVTLHYADVMHASPPPTGAGGRRVLYLTWYNPAILDWIGPGRALNDLVRDRQAAAEELVHPA
jgi:hypothetical protein